MKATRFIALAVLLVMSSTIALAQDLCGKWKLLTNTPIEITYTFSADGICKMESVYKETQLDDEESNHGELREVTLTYYTTASCSYVYNDMQITFGKQVGEPVAKYDLSCPYMSAEELRLLHIYLDQQPETEQKLTSAREIFPTTIKNFNALGATFCAVIGECLMISDGPSSNAQFRRVE